MIDADETSKTRKTAIKSGLQAGLSTRPLGTKH